MEGRHGPWLSLPSCASFSSLASCSSGVPCLPGPPSGWTLASALPGKCLANGPQGLPQVIAGGEMERAGGGAGGQGGGWMGNSSEAARELGVKFGCDFPDPLGDCLLPAMIWP